MAPSSGLHRKTVMTFAIGMSLGFMVTYFGVTHNFNTNLPKQKSLHFIPQHPHSHGETDDFKGPDQAQTWDDLEHESHKGGNEVADGLKQKVRVLCWVMTAPQNLESKAKHVKATWGKHCNKLLFMSSEADIKLPAIGLAVGEGRDNLWAKTKEAFKYLYKNHMDDADWFLKADDDTYVVVENLRRLLEHYNPQEPIHFGRKFKPYVTQGYMSGGAGYVLSAEAVKRFVVDAVPNPYRCRFDAGGAEDLEMGMCLQKVGVFAGDSRDSLGRETFMPFIPEHHLIPGLIPSDNWYWEYNYYPTKSVG